MRELCGPRAASSALGRGAATAPEARSVEEAASGESRVVALSELGGVSASSPGRGQAHLAEIEALARGASQGALLERRGLLGAELGQNAGQLSAPDTQEFLALFQEYERYVASIGSRILGASNGVDDLVQEVFLVIYQEFHKLRELSSVKAWLATIATRLAWRQRGRSWLHSRLSLTQAEELNPLESSDASPELQADLSALLDRLRAMPASLREPWLLRFIDGETLPRIAQLCDCSQSTVQRRLREAGEIMLGEKAPGRDATGLRG